MTSYKLLTVFIRSCFRWTKCNRCVLLDYGPTCLAEITNYIFEVDELSNEIKCLDPFVEAPPDPGSWYSGFGPGEVPGCRRSICECDKSQILALKEFFK